MPTTLLPGGKIRSDEHPFSISTGGTDSLLFDVVSVQFFCLYLINILSIFVSVLPCPCLILHMWIIHNYCQQHTMDLPVVSGIDEVQLAFIPAMIYIFYLLLDVISETPF